MKHNLKSIAAVLLLNAGVLAHASEPNVYADDQISQQATTIDQPFTLEPVSGEVRTLDGNTSNNETPGAPLPINNYEHALMAAGIAVAGYAALRARKQNA